MQFIVFQVTSILIKSWLIRYSSIKFSSPAAGFTYSTTKHMQQSSLNCKGFWIDSFQKIMPVAGHGDSDPCTWKRYKIAPPCQKTLLPSVLSYEQNS